MILPVKGHLMDLERLKNPARTRLGYLRLDKNENTLGFSQEFIDLLKQEINSDFLTAYPEIAPFNQKMARWLGCKKENIYITAGSDAGIKATFEAFVEAGDSVVLLHPTYAMFNVYAKMFQGKEVKINYKQGLVLSTQEVIKVIKRRKPKLVCIANPNSPTGTILPPEGINKIVKLTQRQKGVILIDEAYYPFYPVSAFKLIRSCPNLVIVRTFSKAFGLASARLGFALGHPQIIKYLYKLRPMYETNAFALRFAELIMDNYYLVEQSLKEIKKAKTYLEQELKVLKVPFFRSHTNFILINVGSYKKSLRLAQELHRRRILIKAGFKDSILRDCIRVTIGNVEQIRYFIKNLKQVL